MLENQNKNPHDIKKEAMAAVDAALKRIATETRLQNTVATLRTTVDRKSADAAVHKWANLTLAELDTLDALLGDIRVAVQVINSTVDLGKQSSGPITIGG